MPENVIAFDIGGTSFRSGVLKSNGRLFAVKRRASVSYKRFPNLPVSILQSRLLDYIVDESHRLQTRHPELNLQGAGIAFGGPLNAHTGLILNSGPIWGPTSQPLDILKALRLREPNIDWTVVNDITAALLHHAQRPINTELSRLTLMTVGTGVGCRTFDTRTQSVPVDRVHGLQGEIGHIPIVFKYKDTAIELRCDCGGANHLNAFCSGRGIDALVGELSTNLRRPETLALFHEMRAVPDHLRLQPFAEALTRGDTFATDLLDSVTLPLARVLMSLFTLDPEVERVVLTGGVVDTVGQRYLHSLVGHLEAMGMYQITQNDPLFFRERIKLGQSADNAGLQGAGSAAQRGPATGEVAAGNHSGVCHSAEHGTERWSIQAHSSMSYTVVASHDLFALDNNSLVADDVAPRLGSKRRLVIVDDNVDDLYGENIRRYFAHHGVHTQVHRLKASEQGKNVSAVLGCAEMFEAFGVARRDEPVIAVGGGTLLDIVGVAASLYRRGVPYVRVPTTLLSLVDAGVGAKVGVNFADSKNRIGAYYPPRGAFLDTTFLRSLDSRQMSSGMAEILKLAIVKDCHLFEQLEQHGVEVAQQQFQSGNIGRQIMRSAVHGMLEELAPNLWEHELERPVDFGHSFSPSIEMAAMPELLHGEAVSLDMAICVVLATQRALLRPMDLYRVIDLMKDLKLPITHSVCKAPLLNRALLETARHRGGLQRLPLPTGIGSVVFVNNVVIEEVQAAVRTLKRLAGKKTRRY
jgi:3-dehydroquinate synthetase/predicted NBD/HSP70 family sugar kinase